MPGPNELYMNEKLGEKTWNLQFYIAPGGYFDAKNTPKLQCIHLLAF